MFKKLTSCKCNWEVPRADGGLKPLRDYWVWCGHLYVPETPCRSLASRRAAVTRPLGPFLAAVCSFWLEFYDLWNFKRCFRFLFKKKVVIYSDLRACMFESIKLLLWLPYMRVELMRLDFFLALFVRVDKFSRNIDFSILNKKSFNLSILI